MPAPDNAVILVSGGLDSAVTLASALAEGYTCHALTIDYNQRHRAELDAAGRVARSLGVPDERRHRVALDLRAIGGSCLTSDAAVPRNRAAGEIAQGIPPTYVPARNMLFLSLGVALAETVSSKGPVRVFIGVNAVDFSGYPDCRPSFIRAFERAAAEGTKAGAEGREVRIHAPLVSLSKPEIIRMGRDLKVDLSQTLSCYDPVTDADGPISCGQCDACLIRRRGFEQAGIADPARYATPVQDEMRPPAPAIAK
jgi:7-cyano-7-deazaguanine synthase